MKTANLLIALILCALFPAHAFATLPDISKAIEPKMYKGTHEEILAFIATRQDLIVQLTATSQTLLEQTTDPEQQEILTSAVDIFHNIPAQLNRVQAELKKSADIVTKVPVLGLPPYPLATFDTIRSFKKEIDQNIVEYKKDIDHISKKLDISRNYLESQINDYSRLKQKAEDKGFALGKAAYIFNFQAQHAFFTLQLSRLQKQLEATLGQKEELAKIVKLCLQDIDISEENVAEAKDNLDKALRDQELFLKESRNELGSIDSKLLRYEFQLEKITANIGKEEAPNGKRDLLKIERKRIESIINSLNFRRKDIEQQKINHKINTTGAAFSHERLSRYFKHNNEKRASEYLQSWQEKEAYLNSTAALLREDFLLISQQKLNLNGKLLSTADELQDMSLVNFKETLLGLKGQLLKENETLNALTTTVLDNQNDTRVLAAEINWFIDILQKELPLSENIRVYFEKNVKTSWAKTQSILYYPFFSMGEVDLSLSVILKFIFLLIAGFMLLRLLRRKTSSILHKKTQLSFGAVTSITTLGYYFAVVMTFFIILSLVGVNLSNLTVIFGALGVGIGFGLQAITNNFISGIILLSEQVIKAGDIVKLENDLTGEVKKVAIRSTIIRTVNGDDVIVPNSEFISGRVNTWTYGDDWRRLTIPFGVAYGSDPAEIVRIAEESAREVKITREDADHPVRVIFDGFGDSSLDFSLRVWCRMYQLQALSGLRSDYYFTLFRKIKEAGIEIPFPQRDLHVQSISAQVEKQIGRCFERNEAEDETS